jgi:hypothetical protein
MSETRERLGEIEKRLSAAPEGPWEVVGNTVYFAPQWWVAFLGAIPLADFIAHSRRDIEYLLRVAKPPEVLPALREAELTKLGAAVVDLLKEIEAHTLLGLRERGMTQTAADLKEHTDRVWEALEPYTETADRAVYAALGLDYPEGLDEV